MSAQMASESVAAPAGVAAEGAFEGLLAGVQFDVSQQVSLLGEWDTALVALEWPVAWERKAAEVNTAHTHFKGVIRQPIFFCVVSV